MNNKEKIEKKIQKENLDNNKKEIFQEKKNQKNKELIYKTIQLISKKIQKQPIISILISASIGYILGYIITKKNK